jgi:hypothetical protein
MCSRAFGFGSRSLHLGQLPFVCLARVRFARGEGLEALFEVRATSALLFPCGPQLGRCRLVLGNSLLRLRALRVFMK